MLIRQCDYLSVFLHAGISLVSLGYFIDGIQHFLNRTSHISDNTKKS